MKPRQVERPSISVDWFRYKYRRFEGFRILPTRTLKLLVEIDTRPVFE
jgi:hypothetical protein